MRPRSTCSDGVAAEIDPAQRPRDVGLRRGFDRKAQHRHEVAQRRQPLLAKALVAPRRPVGIEAVHLAHRAGLAEPVHEGDEMLVALGGEIVDHREIERVAIGEIDHAARHGRFRACGRRSSAASSAAASPSLVEPYSKLSLSLVSVSFQRKPRPSKTGCSVSMKTSAARQRRGPRRGSARRSRGSGRFRAGR